LIVRRLRAEVAPFRRSNPSSAIAYFAVVLTLYGAASYAALTVLSLPLRLPIAVAAGIFSGTLFMIGHDACHGSYTPIPRWNRILGRIAFLPSYHTYSLWDLSHNRIHHIKTNLKGQDFVWTPLCKAEFDCLPWWRQILYRVYRTPFGLMLYYPLELWRVRLFFPRRRYLDRPRLIYSLDCLLVLAYMLLQLALFVLIGARLFHSAWDWAGGALFAFVLPSLTFSWMIGFVIYFNHTHPAAPWFDKPAEWSFFTATSRGTVRLKFPRWSLFFASNIMDHLAHHLDPRIPLARLKEAQERLEAVLPGELIVQEWSVRALLDILRRCKLYDYDAHRWTDYDGRPTSDCNFGDDARATAIAAYGE
jgi:omega-6 fatty acid desaturase (delta-12 desaturase)